MSLKKPFDRLRARRESIAELKCERFNKAKAFFSSRAPQPPPSPSYREPTADKWLTLPLTDRRTEKKSKSKHGNEKSPVIKTNTSTCYDVFNSNKGDNSLHSENTDIGINYNINRPGVTTKAFEQSHELNACQSRPQSQLCNSRRKSTSSYDIHTEKYSDTCRESIPAFSSFGVNSQAVRKASLPKLQRQSAVDLPQYDIITLRNTSIENEQAFNTKSTSELSTFRLLDTKLSRISRSSECNTSSSGADTVPWPRISCSNSDDDSVDMGKQKQLQLKVKQASPSTQSNALASAQAANRKHAAPVRSPIEDNQVSETPRPNNTKHVIDKFEHLLDTRPQRRQRGVSSSSNRSSDKDQKTKNSRVSHPNSSANYDQVIDQVLQQRGRSQTQQVKSANRRSKSLSQAQISRSIGQYREAEVHHGIIENSAPKSAEPRNSRPELRRAISVDKHVDSHFTEPQLPIKPILKRRPPHINSESGNQGRTTSKKKITISFSGSDTDSSDLWVRRHDVRRHDNSVFFPAQTTRNKAQKPSLRSPTEGNETSELTHSERIKIDKNKHSSQINQPKSSSSVLVMDRRSEENSASKGISLSNNRPVCNNDMQKCNKGTLAYTSMSQASSKNSSHTQLHMPPLEPNQYNNTDTANQVHINDDCRSSSIESRNNNRTLEGIGHKIFTNDNFGGNSAGSQDKIGLNNHTISGQILDSNQTQHYNSCSSSTSASAGNLLNINNSFSTTAAHQHRGGSSLLSPGTTSQQNITQALSHANYRAIWVDRLPDPSSLTPPKPRSQTEAAVILSVDPPAESELVSEERIVEGKSDRFVEGQNHSDQDELSAEKQLSSDSEIPVIKTAQSTDDLIDFSEETASADKPTAPARDPIDSVTPDITSSSPEGAVPLIDMDCSVDFPPPPTDFFLSSFGQHEDDPYNIIPADNDLYKQTEIENKPVQTHGGDSGMNISNQNQGINPSLISWNATTECKPTDYTSYAQFLPTVEISADDETSLNSSTLQSQENTGEGVKISVTSQVGSSPLCSNEQTNSSRYIHTSTSIEDDVFLPPATQNSTAVRCAAENKTVKEENIYHTIFSPPRSFSDTSISGSLAESAKPVLLSPAVTDCVNKRVDNSTAMPRVDKIVILDVNTQSSGESGHSTTDTAGQGQDSLQTALHRVMRDVPTVSYWDTTTNISTTSSTDKYSDSDSVKSESISPRRYNNADQLKRTSYAARFSSDTDTTGTSYEQLDAGSEDSTSSQSKKRVTIALKGEVAQKRKVSKNQSLSPRSQKSILKKPVWNPIYDTLPSGGSKTDDSDTHSIQSDSALMRRSFSTSNVNGDAPHVRVASEWYVPPPPAHQVAKNSSTLPNRARSGSKASYLNFPIYGKPKDKKSHSLDFIIESAYDSLTDCTSDNMNYRLNKSQSLSRGMHGPRHNQRRSSLADRLTLPARITKMFSKSKKSPAPPLSNLPHLDNYENIDVTLDALYAEWLDGPAKLLPYCERGEGVRTVVLARTKKGYGFVLRGAKAEQLRKLNVQFVPSEKMPALQYLDSVEKGSVSDKAGLRAGDFILEIDNKNVVHASHEQTVQIIKKAGDVLAMKVVRAVLSADGPSTNGGIPGSPQINGSHSNGGVMTGSLSLPAKPQKPGRDDAGSNSSGEVVMMRHKPGSDTNGIHTEEEQLAIEQLDATLANYDSDSRSSGSGAIPNIVIREQKTASIRHRPSSSHFNSIQELDDMFAPPPPPAPPVVPVSQPALLDKNESRKPAKSRAKKFWNKGKSSKLGSGSKQLSLSQPNLAALDPDAEVKPITMYEMSLGHSVDAEGHMSGLPRTFSGDLSSLQRRKSESHASTTSPLPPPPPQFPAPFAPEDDRSSLHSGHSSASSNRTGSFQHHNSLSKSENHRFLPRTPLPSSSKSMSTELHNSSNFQSSGTLQRGKMPPPPPSRTSSYDSGVILTIPGHSAQHTVTAEVNNTPPFPAFNQSNSFSTPAPANHQPPSPEPSQPSNPFADAIRKAAANRNSTPPPPPAPVTNSNSSGASPSMGNELYAAVQKRQARTGGEGASDPPPPPADPKPAQNQGGSGAVSVEDQLRMAVANRRKLIERREPSTSESDTTRSHSVTPERTLSSNTPASEQQQQPGVIKSDSTNFREMAEQKRLDFLRKKADSSPSKPSPVVNSNGPSSDSKTDNNLTELQKVMNRLSVAKTAEDTTDSATEPNNNSQPPPPVHNKKKVPPPVVMKKPPKLSASSQSSVHDHLSPVEEFPPPPPPHEFGSPPPPHSGGSGSAEIIIPPPTFEMSPPNSFSPPIYTPPNKQEQHHHHHNDGDSHSVTSSVGSDTISSVSQDGNRLSVATSGYSSDPSRATKLSFSGKNVDSWTTSEVGDWLDAIGLGEYKGVFDENCIEGETLASMSKADIKELGVEKVGHRVKLDKEIKKLVGESPA